MKRTLIALSLLYAGGLLALSPFFLTAGVKILLWPYHVLAVWAEVLGV